MLTDIQNAAHPARPRTTRVLQFGEGNFLRAFVDWMVDITNERLGLDMGVAVVQPIERGLTDLLNAQDGLYTLLLRGKQGGQAFQETRVIGCVRGCVDPYRDFGAFLREAVNPDLTVVVSNTTEAGIVFTGLDRPDDAPPASFPGKVCRLLLERWRAGLGGLVFLPCELIDDNGAALKACVLRTARLWALPDAFVDWLERENVFLSTLVDRIVTGYPAGEAEGIWETLGYRDRLLDVGEPFALWVIEDHPRARAAFPLDKAGLPVVFAADVHPYKQRKVRMLNGAHTATVLAAYLAGLDTVGECMADAQFRAFLEKALFDEVTPLLPLDQADARAFGASVIERFENPFNRHLLLSIALNSVSKFRARVLPSIKAYCEANGAPPPALTFSMAALLAFYRAGSRDKDGAYPLQDDADALACFEEAKRLAPGEAARYLLTQSPACDTLWGESLAGLPGFVDAVKAGAEAIAARGVRDAMRDAVGI